MASSSLYWQRLSRLALGQQPRLFTSLSTHQPSRRVGIVLTRGVTSSSSASDDVTYARIVEESLSYLQEKLETLENTDIPGLDIEHSDGVLTVKLGEHGTYVINKQAPNRQMWLSSPISGPRRYNWDAATQSWRNTRDQHELYHLLQTEIKQLCDYDVNLAPSTSSSSS